MVAELSITLAFQNREPLHRIVPLVKPLNLYYSLS